MHFKPVNNLKVPSSCRYLPLSSTSICADYPNSHISVDQENGVLEYLACVHPSTRYTLNNPNDT